MRTKEQLTQKAKRGERMTTLILVRHGESKANEKDIYVGQTDVELTATPIRVLQCLWENKNLEEMKEIPWVTMVRCKN